MTAISETPDGAVVRLRVVPRASRNEICGEVGGAIKVRLQAPPVEGRANKALVKFLASRCSVASRDIAILSGERGREKRVLLRGTAAAEIASKLQ
jgi:uncharacterized protein (TIGR00251 family)